MQDIIKAEHLTIGYEHNTVLKDISFAVHEHDVFAIMGASGCGKSTLLRVLSGLMPPLKGSFYIDGIDFTRTSKEQKNMLMQQSGILYQSGALFTSMTLLENVSLPLQEYSDFSPADITQIAKLKLALVGLKGFEGFYPSEISGGMKKRAGLARALALDPKIVYFDEPSAGLDPVSSRRLDELILNINQSLGTTIIIVSHELPSIFSIANNSIFLSNKTHGIEASGDPKELLKNPPSEEVALFLTRGDYHAKKAK